MRDAEDLAQVPVLGQVRVAAEANLCPTTREALAWLAKRIELLNADGSRRSRWPRPIGRLGGSVRLSPSDMQPAVARRSSCASTGAIGPPLTRHRSGSTGCSPATGWVRTRSRAAIAPACVVAGGAGLEAAAESASRDRTKHAVEGLREIGDLAVIVTDPPLDSLAALLVVAEASSVVLVLDRSHARRRRCAAAANTLRQVGARLVGIALVDGVESPPSASARAFESSREVSARPTGDPVVR